MRLTLRQLQIFLAIAESGSTTTAAAAVSLTQSATSAALNQLEDLLGAGLFDRIGRRLVINDSGRALLPQARHLLDAATEIEQQFTKPDKGAGKLRIGASTTIGNYLMPGLLAAYGKDVDVSQIHVRIANTEEIVTAVANLQLDIGFIEGPCHDDQLTTQQWIKDELVLFASSAHPLCQRQRRITLDELRKASWLLREPGSGTREAVERVLGPHLRHMRSGISFGDSEAIKRAVAAGMGISCLSRWVVADMLRHQALKELDTTLPALSRMFHIVRHPQKHLSRSLDQFVQFSLGWPTASEESTRKPGSRFMR
ncbi:MAG TPA: LysR family transcriptional regulator [Ramlibacter sp.]|nr:LysR family transcriptional regulator [Ramlibacter sp.]